MVDTFICGACQLAFHDIGEFLQHKDACCEETTPQQQQQQIQVVLEAGGSISAILVEPDAQELPLEEVQAFPQDVEMGVASEPEVRETEGLPPEQELEAVAIIPEPSTAGAMVVTTSDEGGVLSWPDANTKIQLILSSSNNEQPKTVVNKEVKVAGRKRGRPKKGEEKSQPEPIKPVKIEKPSLPERASDGFIHCPGCKKVFRRERHFVSHKCLAMSDYVDITKKELVHTDELDSDGEAEEGTDGDNTADFHVYNQRSLPGRRRRQQRNNMGDDIKNEHQATTETTSQVPAGASDVTKGTAELIASDAVTATTDPGIANTNPESSAQSQDDLAVVDVGGSLKLVKADLLHRNKPGSHGRLPVFVEEEDKVAFEQNINVDLSQVDGMFRTLVVEQKVNENAPPPSSRTMNELSIYSCNVCEKVFMSLSHMRQHCLIHTTLRPFHCSKCDYSTNTKGNLYTHMRKHTGQFYRCEQCSFKTTNKGHLVEHEATHTGRRHTCDMCHKDYNTVKSLQNHIRKYHLHLKTGRDYLARFQIKTNKCTAVLHQCHICNRKFKKKVDCDRHLFVHNIKDNPNVYACELCSYAASRRMYLDKHFRRHRVVYFCCHCDGRFASTIRLTQHLNEVHLSDSEVLSEAEWEELFWRCIKASLYLPEPGGAVEEWEQDEGEGGNEGAENWAGDVPRGDAGVGNESRYCTPEGDAAQSEGVTITECLSGQEIIVSKSGEIRTNADGSVSESLVSREGDGLASVNQTGEVASVRDEQTEAAISTGIEPTEEASLSRSNPTEGAVSTDISPPEDAPSTCIDSTMQAMTTDITPTEDAPITDSPSEMTVTVLDETSNMSANDDPGRTVLMSDSTSSVTDRITTPVTNDCDLPDADATPQTDYAAGDAAPQSDYAAGDAAPQSDDATGDAAGDVMPPSDDAGGDATPQSDDAAGDAMPQSADAAGDVASSMNDIFERLGFSSMSMEVFQELRETFGNEECEYCGRLFYSKSDHEAHIRTHTGDKPYACDQCSYRAITKENLKRHIEKEHAMMHYVCTECNFEASNRTQLWVHQQKHKLEAVTTCQICHAKFDTNKRLKIHVQMKHPEITVVDLRKMLTPQRKSHGKIGRKTHKCPYCSRTFLRANSDLQKHIWIHEGVKPFKCTLCPHACRSKNNLAAHMLRHSSEKPFLCTECGKAYKSKTALRWHIRSHKDGKIFKCNRCSYEALQKSHLKRHMETHNVVKRFVCEHCDYSANTIGYLKIHYTRHHKGSQYQQNPAVVKPMTADTKFYRCLSCDYLFGNLSDMKRHLRIRHHIHIEDMQALEKLSGASQVTQVMPADGGGGGQVANEIGLQVVHVETLPATADKETPASTDMLQYSEPQPGMDEKTVSAVNLLQQIIDMSQQGAFGADQSITVQSQGGQRMVVVKPDTVVATDADVPAADQYVIQYIDEQQGIATDVNQVVMTDDGQHVMVSEDGQRVMVTEDGHRVMVTEDGQHVMVSEDGQRVMVTEDGQHVVVTDDGQHIIVSQDDEQVIMTQDGEQVIVTQNGEQVIMTQDGEQIIVTQDSEHVVTTQEDQQVFVTQDGEQVIMTEDGEQMIITQGGEQFIVTQDGQQVVITDDSPQVESQYVQQDDMQDDQQIVATSLCQEIVTECDTSIADSIINVTPSDSEHVTTVCDGEIVSIGDQEILTSDCPQEISMTTTADE